MHFLFPKVLHETLTFPANVADKIGDKGMDLSKAIDRHILDKLDEMITDEEKAIQRNEELFKLVKVGLEAAIDSGNPMS